MEAHLLVMCIAYKNYAEVASYLETILSAHSAHKLRVIVVDNTPVELEQPEKWLLSMATKACASGRLFVVGDGVNRGYFGGFRLGYHHAQSVWGRLRFSWVVLSNTDLRVETENWVEILLNTEAHQTAAVAPVIISSRSGKDQNPLYVRRPSAIKFACLAILFSSLFATALHRALALAKGRLKAARANKQGGDDFVYAAHGSFICLSEAYFKNGGALECPTFLFCEEIFLAEEIMGMGMRIERKRELRVTHREHATTSFVPNATIRKHLARAHWAAYQRIRG